MCYVRNNAATWDTDSCYGIVFNTFINYLLVKILIFSAQISDNKIINIKEGENTEF